MIRKKWCNADLLMLGELYRAGLTYSEIGNKMSRSQRSIAVAVSRYRHVININYRNHRKIILNPEENKIVAQRIYDLTPQKTRPWWIFWR